MTHLAKIYSPDLTLDDRQPRQKAGAAPHLSFRRDIEGLRALAVLPVILGHASVKGFYGGYVGVDIFFVISGYLITGILLQDVAADRYSITEFYRRRILRILPALFFMLAAVSLVACVAMLPIELLDYARSLIGTTLFSSNILFYTNIDYFAQAANEKPLLHTWSLAIEEQFYILWPLLLSFTGSDRRGYLKAAVLATTVVSFAVSAWLVAVDASAAFYLLPARAWELSIGATIAITAARIKPRWLNEVLAALGLLGILFAVAKYNSRTAFPGPAALLPCVGAALLIVTGSANTLVSRGLALPLIAFIGRISYSLYLWHWPVLVFGEMWLFLPKTPLVITCELLTALTLATFSWRFLEQPFRLHASGWSTRRVLLGGAAAMGVPLAAAALLFSLDGLSARLTPAQRSTAEYASIDVQALYRRNTCFDVGRAAFDAEHCLAHSGERPPLLLIGDSYAAHYWPGLSRHRDRYDVLQATATGCRPLLYPATAWRSCQRFFGMMLREWLPTHETATVLLAGRWQVEDIPLLDETLDDPTVRAAHPILVGPMPEYTAALPRLLVFADKREDVSLVTKSFSEEVLSLDRDLRALAGRHGVPYLSPIELLCRGDQCRAWATDLAPMQFDRGHLTEEGSIFLVDAFMPRIDETARRESGR